MRNVVVLLVAVVLAMSVAGQAPPRAAAVGPYGAWETVAPMSVPRAEHTLTLLHDGRVLALGGRNASGPLASGEIYDPATNTWTPIAPMSEAKYGHTATLNGYSPWDRSMVRGAVLVAGGIGEVTYNYGVQWSELYQPQGGYWVDTGPLPAQYGHAATSGSSPMLTGGVGDSGVPSGYVVGFEPTSHLNVDSWTIRLPLLTARMWHTSSPLPDHRVLTAGGRDGAAAVLAGAELHTPSLAASPPQPTTAATMLSGRFGHVAVALPSGDLLVAGGLDGSALSSSEVYDWDGDAWSSAGSAHTIGFGAEAGLLANAQAIVAGGASDEDGLSVTAAASIYDPATQSWHAAASMSEPRYDFGGVALPDGRFMVAGGSSGPGQYSASVEIYTADSDRDGVIDTADANDDDDALLDAQDNCPTAPNDDQANADRDFIDLPPWKAFDDKTRPNSDNLGDACDLDDDNDGRTDVQETTGAVCAGFASSPTLLDSDGDGIADGAECSMGLDPSSTPTTTLVGCGGDWMDFDGDGVLYALESCSYGTTEFNTDTDGDGCQDGQEVASVNGDRTVSALDLMQVAQSFGAKRGTPQYIPSFDIFPEGTISAIDLSLVAQHFGACTPGGPLEPW